MPDEEQALEPILPKLTNKELAALHYFEATNQAEIAPVTAARMFTVFLNGSTCEAIQRLNPGFSLAQIVHTRVKDGWDRQRDEYLKDLYELQRIRALQTTLESTNFIADMLSVANSEFGEKLRRYSISRNPADLPELRIETLKDYKEAVALLQSLTGQDKQTRVGGEVVVTHRNEPEKVTPAVAASILKELGPATK